MKHKNTKKIIIVFIISFFTLFLNPYISLNVLAAPNLVTFGFEEGTLNQAYDATNSGVRLVSSWDDGDFEVDNIQVYSGVQSFYWDDPVNNYQYWNYTYVNGLYLTEWYVWVYAGGTGSMYISFYNHTNMFSTDRADHFVALFLDTADDDFEYIDHNSVEQKLCNLNQMQFQRIGFKIVSNNSIIYNYNGTEYSATPANSSYDLLVNNIDRVQFTGAGSAQASFDENAITIDTIYPGQYGNITINAYNESNITENIVNYSISVFSDTGGFVQFYENCTNPYIVNLSDIGSDGFYYFQFNHENFSSRTYYSNIVVTNSYILDAYLPPLTANLYYIKVINEYAQPVHDANIVITRSLGGAIREMNSGTTDYFGMHHIYLLAETNYFINISADGYESIQMDSLFPDPDYYGYDYPIIYQLRSSDINFSNETIYWERITFNGHISGTTLYVNYTDTMTETIDTSLRVYEINQSDSVESVFGWDNKTDNDDFQATFSNVNISNCYRVVLFLNHSTFGFVVDTFTVCANKTVLTNKTTFDDLFNINYGTSPGGFGWSNIFGFIILMSGLFGFGQRGSGVALIVTGGLLLFVNNIIGLTVIAATVSILLIVLGILVLWVASFKEARI